MTAASRSCARCDWTADHESPEAPRVQAAAHAVEAQHPLCIACGRSLSGVDPALTCERCLTSARETLSGVVTMWLELPRHLGIPTGQRYDAAPRGGDEHGLPGGAILALLAPGSAGGAARRLTRSDRDRGVDGREHQADNRPDDTPSVAWSLATWEDDWRHMRSEPAAVVPGGTSAVVRAAARYLEVHARWAANQHPAFDEFVSDMRALHLQLEQATGRRRVPAKAGADCFDCGGALIREVNSSTGLEDDQVTCRACRTRYDEQRYRQALKAAAESASQLDVAGEAYATPTVLASSLGRSERSIRDWRRRELVRAVERGGVLFVNVGDVSREHAERGTRCRTTSA